MSDKLRCISPVDGSVYVERDYATSAEIEAAIERAVSAQNQWKRTSISERADICTKATDAFVAMKDKISEGLTWQMGRPIRYGVGEVGGVEERARHMIAIAEKALADVSVDEKDGFTRFIRRDPLGVVFVIAPWNYPYLTSVNSIIPAIMSGNAVILKHSAQTPLCAEIYAEAFEAAGLPKGVFQYLHLNHADTETLIKAAEVDFVAFTGSVPGGAMVENAAAGRFVGVGLELGGKDPAYVRADADVRYAAEGLVDGAFFNSGQSCCGIERIYVHECVYDEFVDIARQTVLGYKVGNPTDPDVTIGPLVRASAADFVRKQTTDAIAAGARALVPEGTFGTDESGSAYLGPQILVDVDHSMDVMTEESFGPVVGIMKVSSDDEAIRLMNDSDFGLTASIWTADSDEALRIGDEVSTGTWFMNRCDYLDPALAWTGVKDSGRGCTLSALGYDHLTRPKSFHLKTQL
jgi:acyl-CoA reductase-like NAD-dependent aldehyde dehydrogenase